MIIIGLIYLVWFSSALLNKPELLNPFAHVAGQNVLGSDYSIFRVAGRAVLSGQADIAYLSKLLGSYEKELLPNATFLPWVYPPTHLLLVAPLGLGEYAESLYIFLAVSVLVFIAFCYGRLSTAQIAAVIFSPPFIVCLYLGQMMIILSALSFTCFYMRERNKIFSALCLAIFLMCKPHIALLIPLYLFIKKDWKTLIYTAIFCVIGLVISIAVFGWQLWPMFLREASALDNLSGDNLAYINVYSALKLVVGNQYHLLVFAVIALAGLALATKLWLSCDDYKYDYLVYALLTCLVIPHYLPYDFIIISIALAGIWSREDGDLMTVAKILVLGLPIMLIRAADYFKDESTQNVKLYAIYALVSIFFTLIMLNRRLSARVDIQI